MRASLAILTVAFLAACHRPPQLALVDHVSIAFTNTDRARPDGLVIGTRSRARFIDTLGHRQSSFDPKFLELSYPMGVFFADDRRFDYHLGLLVYREGKKVHIWESDFTRQLGQELMNTNGSWKQMLQQ